MKNALILILFACCLFTGSSVYAQSDDSGSAFDDTDGIDADNWKSRYFGVGLVAGKPIHVGGRLIGQFDRYGLGVEFGKDNFSLGRKTEFDANVIRAFALFRLTYDPAELFQVHPYAGYTMYDGDEEYGDLSVADAGVQLRLQLNFVSLSADIGAAFPVSDNEFYEDQNLGGLNVGLSVMFWPF